MKAVRVNEQITEVKQLKTNNFKMGDHLYFVFPQWQKYQANQANFPNLINQMEFRKNSIDAM